MNNDDKYLCNGKAPIEVLHGLECYDYGARFYDPALGRWHCQDPLAEKFNEWSPYNYVLNNPVTAIDPDGLDVLNAHEEDYNNSITDVQNKARSFNRLANSYGVRGNISKKDFLNAGLSKSDWKNFKASRNSFKASFNNFKSVAKKYHEAQEDINAFRSGSPTLFNKLDNLSHDVYIGRGASIEIEGSSGGGPFYTEFGVSGPSTPLTRKDIMYESKGHRQGFSIWLSYFSYSGLFHEAGHIASYYGGIPSLNIPAVNFGTTGNPSNLFDLKSNYQHWFTQCYSARGASNLNNYNPTTQAAIIAERLRPSVNYIRVNFNLNVYLNNIGVSATFR